ncbi:RagB/SusD family nutrient uptake outer membrane protein [Pedobacter ureilyticus]|uniref:RagB/SusD family nutrient uptake outer membrane protein n=2 Tax=Pedobacter ureilyticus TaxID=1393051 RepID=A0ABW9J389_9SPHI
MKKMKKNSYFLMLWLMLATGALSCKKYLDAKPNKQLATISSLTELQALLDDHTRLNYQTVYAAEAASDDFYLTDQALNALSLEGDRRVYNWQKGNQFEGTVNGWYYSYLGIYYGNTILESLNEIERTNGNAAQWDNIKGQGYYYKGSNLLNAAMVWALAYAPNSASQTLGLPLRASVDFNVPSTRASLEDTYQQLLSDLKNACRYLAVQQVHVMRPSKAAAYAMVSRAYLMMNKYAEAALYADTALQLKSELIDYNNINATATNPFPEYGMEVLHHVTIANPAVLNQSNASIVDELYNSYAADDLRKKVFFTKLNNRNVFKGNYSGQTSLFFGPAVDEMYLNRAEGYARTNQLPKALADLNTLMLKRWDKTKTYVPYNSSDQQTVIAWVLAERRKELLMRGLRWGDVKRLNTLGYGIKLERKYNSSGAVLEPKSSGFAMSIPETIIDLTGMPQN